MTALSFGTRGGTRPPWRSSGILTHGSRGCPASAGCASPTRMYMLRSCVWRSPPGSRSPSGSASAGAERWPSSSSPGWPSTARFPGCRSAFRPAISRSTCGTRACSSCPTRTDGRACSRCTLHVAPAAGRQRYAGYIPSSGDVVEWGLRRRDPTILTELRRGHPLYVVVAATDTPTNGPPSWTHNRRSSRASSRPGAST